MKFLIVDHYPSLDFGKTFDISFNLLFAHFRSFKLRKISLTNISLIFFTNIFLIKKYCWQTFHFLIKNLLLLAGTTGLLLLSHIEEQTRLPGHSLILNPSFLGSFLIQSRFDIFWENLIAPESSVLKSKSILENVLMGFSFS